jgi:hypothetical protein
LRAELAWPVGPNRRIQVLGAAELVRRLVPVARQGLEQAGVAGDEADRLLAVIDARARTGQTGASWQRRTLAALEPSLGRERALAAMLDRYMRHSATGAPVHSWPVPDQARPAPAAARRRLLELRAVPPVSASRTSS